MIINKVKEVEFLREYEEGIYVQYLRLDAFKRKVEIASSTDANIAVIHKVDCNLITIDIVIEYLDEVQHHGSQYRRIKDWLYNIGEIAHQIGVFYRNASLENKTWVVYTHVGKKSAPLNSEHGAKIEEVRTFLESYNW